MPRRVLVVLADARPVTCDASHRDLEVHFVAVLEHALVGLDELRRALDDPPGAVVATSRRAVEALQAVRAPQLPDVYVVGPTTARAAAELACPAARVVGAESGTGDDLARLAVARAGAVRGRWLVLVGDKTRDVVATALRAAGARVVELRVYETAVRADFAAALDAVLADLGAGAELFVGCCSPSGVDALFDAAPGLDARYIAIGPTTRARLIDHGVAEVEVADRPTVDEMALAASRARRR